MMNLDQRLEVSADELRAAAASLPARSWERPLRRGGTRLALAVAGTAMAALLIVAPLVLLAGGRGASPSTGLTEATTVEPSTTLPGSTMQPATTPGSTEVSTTPTTVSEPALDWDSLGEPISDEEYAALFRVPPEEPGTGRRLAWVSGFNGVYDLGLFAHQEVWPEIGEERLFCLDTYGSLEAGRNPFGGSQCATTLERFADMLAFGAGGSGTCLEPASAMFVVWGVPDSADSVLFVLSDGSQLVGQTGDGVALVAWRGDLVVRSVTFEGETPDQADIIWGYTDPQLFQPGWCSE
jgi:hypothetical protein